MRGLTRIAAILVMSALLMLSLSSKQLVYASEGGGKASKTSDSAVRSEIRDKIRVFMLKLGMIPKVVMVAKEPLKLPSRKLYAVVFKQADGKVGLVLTDDKVRYVFAGLLYRNGEKPQNALVDVVQHDPEFGRFLVMSMAEKGNGQVDMAEVTKYAVYVGKKGIPTLYIFFDPLCPHCHRELVELKEKVKEGKVRLGLRYVIVHGEEALDTMAKAECIRHKEGTDKYLDYITDPEKNEKDVDVKCSEAEMAKYRRFVRESSNQAIKLGIKGTPTTVYKGRVYEGYRPWLFWEKTFEAERNIKRVMRSADQEKK